MQKIIDYKLSLVSWSATNQGEIGRIMKDELHLSKREISRLKFDGKILVGSKQVHVNDHMKVGETLTLIFPEDPRQETKSLSVVPDILYEDEDTVVVNKPSGIPVHASHGHQDDSMGTILSSWYGARGMNFVVRAIGRLDSPVSGAEVYAKNKPAAARLTRQREENKLQKTYTALVSGFPEQKKGTIDTPIASSPDQKQRFTAEDGQPAVTHYTVKKQFIYNEQEISLLEVKIDTGRTHQIRVHLSSIGHPLLGDELYGGDTSLINRAALHSSQVVFCMPFTEEEKVIEAPLPEDMKTIIEGRSKTVTIPVIREDAQDPADTKSEKKPVRPAYVDTYEEDEPERKKGGLFWLLLVPLLAAIIFLGYQRYLRNQRYSHDREEAVSAAYEGLNIVFEDIPAAEYGEPFEPSKYVREANAPYSAEEVSTASVGRTTVNYTLSTVTSFGNEVSRVFPLTLEIVDTVPPVITLKETRVEAPAGTRYNVNDNIESVKDPVDGDLVQIAENSAEMSMAYYIDDSQVDISKPGVYVVTVTAADNHGNRSSEEFRLVMTGEGKAEETVTAEAKEETDAKAPVIMVRYANVDVTAGDAYDPRSAVMYVRDETDGDLVQAETLQEGTYTIESSIDLSKPGVYTVTITAMDKSKNRSDERFTVTVKEKTEEKAEATPTPTPAPEVTPTPEPQQTVTDTTPPVIMVRYANVNVTAGSGYTVGQGIMYIRDDTDGDLPYADVLQNGYYTVQTDLDANTPGVYTVKIQAKDKAGNTSSEQFTVKVNAKQENTPDTSSGTDSGSVPAANTPAGQIYSYITGTMGLNRAAAFGILAHMQRESGYNPKAYNPAGYYGLCQWGGGRYDNLQSWCDEQGLDYQTIDGQVNFMYMELQNSYSSVLSELRSIPNTADGAYDAAYVFGMRYEVSGEYLADSAGQTAMEMFNQ